MMRLAVLACAAAAGLCGCNAGKDRPVAQQEATSENVALAPDARLCGTEPLPPIKTMLRFQEGPKLKKSEIEDAYSEDASKAAENCTRAASFLFAQSQENVEVVVKAVVAECRSDVLNHSDWCKSLKPEAFKGTGLSTGTTFYGRMYCGDAKPAAQVIAELQEEAYALVVRARAGRCWLLPSSEGG